MATSATQQEMVDSCITVKNTFLDVKRLAEDTVRRSSSVPRTFKPVDFLCFKPEGSACGDSPISDDSTSASEKNFPANSSDSEQDFPDYHSDCTDDNDFVYSCAESLREPQLESPHATTDEAEILCRMSRVTLSLADMVTADAEKVRAKLRAQAQPFKSARTPPSEVMVLIANAVAVLSGDKDIVDVQVHDGGMGGTTMIVAKSASKSPDALWILSLVKDALLDSAEQSENTYILGYGAQAFNNLDPLSFSCNIGCVPASHQNTACWDTYEKGFCPRCSTCRWDHPAETDTMRVIVMVKQGDLAELVTKPMMQ